MANLTEVELITPERVLFSGDAEAVVMRTDGGDITFLANHMDYIAAVDICVVHIEAIASPGSPTDVLTATESAAKSSGAAGERGGDGSRGEPAPAREVRAAVHGGFVMVAD